MAYADKIYRIDEASNISVTAGAVQQKYDCQVPKGGNQINIATPENPIETLSVTDHIFSANNYEIPMFVYLPNWERA